MIVDLTQLHRRITPYLIADDISLLDKFYCQPQLSYDWKQAKELKDSGGTFEARLKEFLRKDLGSLQADNILVLMGGIGTGKTTTVNRVFNEVLSNVIQCFHKSALGHNCSEKPLFLKLDFRQISESDFQDKREAENEFWTYVAAQIEVSSPFQLPVLEEVTEFWDWCLKQSILLANSAPVHKHLEAWKPHFRSILTKEPFLGLSDEQLQGLLIQSRQALIDQMEPVDLSWYKAHLLKYSLQKQRATSCKCFYLCFDNADHLHPQVQKIAVPFAINLSELTSARAIITIRPLTWERSIHAQRLTSYEYQYTPPLEEVIKKRVQWFLSEQQPDEDFRKTLHSLVKAMTEQAGEKILSRLLLSTSGLSIRFACRNFSNMLESPLLSRIQVNNDDPISDVKISVLARAYFFGKKDSMLSHAFDNLYAINNTLNLSTALLKPRILDYIVRYSAGHAYLQKLLQFLESFGYDDESAFAALNELLDRQRPLLWSNVDFRLYPTTPDCRLVATPIGKKYYHNLLGEVSYDEVCFATDLEHVIELSDVYHFHQQLTDQDISKEVDYFLSKHNSRLYQHFYPINLPCITYHHCFNMMQGLPRRATHERDFYDIQRLEWIKRRINDRLNEPE